MTTSTPVHYRRWAMVWIASLGLTGPLERQAYTPPGPDSATAAAAFLAELVARSPEHDGVPLRRHEIRDVDWDGKFEVLEWISAYEATPGFLDAEISPAFDWANVYRERSGSFEEATGEFPWFLQQQRLRYQHWLEFFESSGENDRPEFAEILRRYIARIDELAESWP